MARELLVYLFGRKVGVLQQEDGRLRFSYDQVWLKAPEARPLSQSLPLRDEPFDDRLAGHFLPDCCRKVIYAPVWPKYCKFPGKTISLCWMALAGNVPGRSH